MPHIISLTHVTNSLSLKGGFEEVGGGMNPPEEMFGLGNYEGWVVLINIILWYFNTATKSTKPTMTW